MPEPEDLSPEAVAIVQALLAAEADEAPRPVTEAELVRFACKWSTEEEEEALLEALSTDPLLRAQFVQILDRVSGPAGEVRLSLASELASVREFALRAAGAAIQALSALRFPLSEPQDPDAARILTHTLREIGQRISAPPAFAALRGGSPAESAQIDAEGTLHLASEGPVNLVDAVLGDIPLSSSSVDGFGPACGLNSGPVPSARFRAMGEVKELWALLEDQSLAFPIVAGPEVSDERLTLELALPEGLAGYTLDLDLRAGPIQIQAGSWPVASREIDLSVDLPGFASGPVPLALLALSLRRG